MNGGLIHSLELCSYFASDEGLWGTEEALVAAIDRMKSLQVVANEGLQQIIKDGGIDSYQTARYTLEKIIEMLER